MASDKKYNKQTFSMPACSRKKYGRDQKKRKSKVGLKHKTKVQDETERIRKQKWIWAGHMIRGKNKWSKIDIQWYPRRWKKNEREATKKVGG
ncbi:hypothetical protein EVAR_97080_1 [Eumeta japonica]|uniref:Uncharacterized protein n=1 Tax=Eumeta variegata TaxID=151549 RepID=A0A4C1X8W7_EUMVA|nr:hypothetical protein EVAR_97080_1 [Eumeta japonica]